jgi:hypothetical protein
METTKFSTKQRGLYFAIATCSAIAVILIVTVRYGGTYNKREYNARRGGVQSINEVGKHFPDPKNSVEKRKILKSWEQVRLPGNIEPKHYDMLIQVNLIELTFSGKSSIYLQVTTPTSTIIFHINKLKIEKVEIRDLLGLKAFKIKTQFQYKKNQFFVVELIEKLDVGQYILKLKFNGNIGTKELNGFYRSTYKSKDGETRYICLKNYMLSSTFRWIQLHSSY